MLSAVDSKVKKLTERAMAALVSEGPICATRISYRQPYISALTGGKAGHEVEEDLRPEIDSPWGEVKPSRHRALARPAPLELLHPVSQ